MEKSFKKCIIFTTINQYTKTSIPYFLKYDFDIIVVGDQKTPADSYQDKNIIYLSKDYGRDKFKSFDKILPKNHYCQKNIGYLYAFINGYDLIFETDDDTFPLNNFSTWQEELHFKNIISPNIPNFYTLFTNKKIWARGYPLELVNKKQDIIFNKKDLDFTNQVSIYQSLVNGNPDVDAIYRLTNENFNENFTFKQKLGLIFAKEVYAQGNTQATTWIDKDLFYLTYVPATVTFRFCDILKMYVAQKCIWQKNKLFCITSPIVKQIRNQHNLLDDFKSELPMYKDIFFILNDLLSQVKLNGNKDDLYIIYKKLYDNNIVEKQELNLIETWLYYF